MADAGRHPICRPAPAAALLAALACGAGHASAQGGPTTRDETPRADSGVPFDLQGFLRKQLQAGARRIVVPPGRYRVSPTGREHLRLDGLENVEIVADGVEMICTQTTRALTIRRCRNVTVRGLAIDYDPLPFTQGRIVAMADDRRWLDVELFDGYPTEGIEAFKFEIFDPATDTLRTETYHGIAVEQTGKARIRVTKTGGYRYDPTYHLERVGDVAVIAVGHAPGGSIPHAVYCEQSAGVRLDGVSLYASNCFGFFESRCDGTRYLRCRIDRRGPESDLRKRAYRRVRSLNADAFHSKHATTGPRIEQCVARYQGDDAVNICGSYHMIVGAEGKALRVLAKGEMDIAPGDPVEVLSYEGRRLPDAVAKAVVPEGAIREEERAFLARQRMDEGIRTGRFLKKAYAVTLDRAVEVARGSVICSANRVGNGFAVRDNTFGFNRSRGILIKASGGEVSGNRLEGCWGEAIKVAPEFWWLEAGSSSKVRIAGNRIRACRGVGIAVYAFGGRGDVAPAGAHDDITIADNTITDSPLPGILVTSTTHLHLARNVLDLSATRKVVPWAIGRFRIGELKPIVLLNTQPSP